MYHVRFLPHFQGHFHQFFAYLFGIVPTSSYLCNRTLVHKPQWRAGATLWVKQKAFAIISR
jgi:hypothetical protein